MEGRRATRVIEFFGGIGACTQALKRLGIDFEVVDYVEVDKYPVASYNAMNDTNFEPQDICQWDKDVTDIDLIMHGSPCQDFSIAGHGKGGDEGSGTRSSLMYETLRIVEKIKPRIVIWENVKGLLSPKHRHNYDAYLQRMSDMGYTNHYQVMNAKHYGIPQNRERIFTVSLLDGSADFKFPEKQELKTRLKDILENAVEERFYLTDEQVDKFKARPAAVVDSEGNIEVVGRLDIKGNDMIRRVYGVSGISPTLGTCGGENQQPKIMVREATKKGYAEEGDSINIEQPNSQTRRGRVGHGVAQTITTSCQQAVVEPVMDCIKIGNVNPSGHGMNGNVYSSEGLAPTITTNKGEGMKISVEPINEYEDGIARPLKAQYYKTRKANFEYSSTYGVTGVICGLKLRKLTPLECWRLMGFDDEVFYKAQKVNSNTQLYKEAGNSIVVNVLYEILKQLKDCGAL